MAKVVNECNKKSEEGKFVKKRSRFFLRSWSERYMADCIIKMMNPSGTMTIMLKVISRLLSQMKDHSPAMNFPGCSLLPMEKQLLNPLLHRCSAQKSGKALANPLFTPG